MTGIDLKTEGSLHTLVCNSTGSPPTTVLWTFNNEPITVSHGNSRSQYSDETKAVIDRKKSSYSSMLNINGSSEDIVGQYSCQVRNQLGASSKVTKEIKGEFYVTQIMLDIYYTILNMQLYTSRVVRSQLLLVSQGR